MVGKQRFRSNEPRERNPGLENWMAPAINGVLFVAFCAGALWCIDFCGDFCVGTLHPLALLICIGVPLVVCTGFFVGLRLDRQAKPWHTVVLLLTVALGFPIYRQPWNPRVAFVTRLDGLKGKTVAQVQKEMKGYSGGEVSRAEPGFVPEDLQLSDVTHVIGYRWNEDDWRYNADVGEVFLKDGIVVGTQFSPD